MTEFCFTCINPLDEVEVNNDNHTPCFSCDCDPLFCSGGNPDNNTPPDTPPEDPTPPDNGDPSGFQDDTNGTCFLICGNYLLLDETKCECTKLPRPWYLDKDGDGWHSDTQLAEDSPGDLWRKTTKGEDCDDDNPDVTTNCYKTYYIDNDGDGWDGGTISAKDDNGGLYKNTTKGKDCDDGVFSVSNICSNVDCNTSKEDLKSLFPSLTDAKAAQLADVLNKFSKFYGIDTKEKLQHFIAQAGAETDNFKSFREGSNYQPKIVMQTFGKYFNDIGKDNVEQNKNNLSSIYTLGQKYVDGEKLFNIVYDDRNPNRSKKNLLGNIQNGDGYKFRGSGALHITGRENVIQFTDFYNSISGSTPKDFTTTPNDLNTNFEISIHAGMWFFKKNILEVLTNFQNIATSTNPTIIKKLTDQVSKIINGGDNGLSKRENLLNDSKTKIKCN